MQRGDSVHRAIAKTIDFLIVGTLCTIPSPIGVFAGALYILISDGFFTGQSLGKKLVGLKVVVRKGGEGRFSACTFRESMVRNLPYAVIFLLGVFPLLGWILFFAVGVPVIAVEAYFAHADDRGLRIGDIFADTQVVDASMAAA